MPLYCYKKKKNNPYKSAIDRVAYGAIIIGCLILFWSFYPILSYKIYAHLFIRQNISTPVPLAEASTSYGKVKSTLANENILSTNLSDYTKASSWFPEMEKNTISIRDLSIKEYTLSIPTLNIKNSRVVVGGDDLAESMIQYRPDILPGQTGKAFIFGHSTNPILYKQGDPKSIFTYLPTMKIGERIIVTIQDVNYEFEVFDKFEVKPDEISVLNQQLDDSYLILITCTPPGTIENRLIVSARLVELP